MSIDRRGVGLLQYCRNDDERDLFWYYQEAAHDMGVIAFCPTDAAGDPDFHETQIGRRFAAARHHRIRVVLLTLRAPIIAALEACYGPQQIGQQALGAWGIAAGAILTAGGTLGKPLTDKQKDAKEDALLANLRYRQGAQVRRQAERVAREERHSLASVACTDLLWAMADKRRKEAPEAVQRAARLLSEIGGNEWLDLAAGAEDN